MWNKENLKVGELVCLDADVRGGSKVKINNLTTKGLIATVEANGKTWDVMTYRLSRILKG